MSDTAIESPVSTAVAAWLGWIGRFCAGASFLFGASILVGWVTQVDLLRSWVTGHVLGKPNTGVALMAAAATLALALRQPHRRAGWLARVLAGLAGLVGLLTSLEYAFGLDLGIDQVLFREGEGAVETVFPGRMSVITALELQAFACAFALREWGDERHRTMAQWVATAALLAACTALVGYTFGARALYGSGQGTTISLPAAVGLALLCAGLLCANPGSGWMTVVAGRRAGGVLLRRLLPFALFAPWLVGWLSIAGSEAGLYSVQVDQAAVVLPLTLLFAYLLHSSARVLDRLDAERECRQSEVEDLNRDLESRVLRRTQELLASREALRLGEGRYRSLVEATAQIVWTADPQGQVSSDMPSWRAFTGQSWEQVRGWGWLESLHPDDRAGTAKQWTSAVQARAAYSTEYRIRRHDGEYRHMWARGVPVFGEGGVLREWVGTCSDITERKHAEDDLRQQAALLQLAPAAILTRDLEGRILFWSRGAEALYGWKSEEVIGRAMHDVLRTVFSDPLPEIEGRVLSGQVWQGELEHIRRDGERMVAGSRWALQRNERGEPAGFLEINVDITEQKRAERELRRLNRALKALNRCTDALVGAGDESSLLQRVCDIIVQVGGYPLAWVGYAEEDRDQTVRPVAIAGLGADYVRHARITWADNERGRGPTGTSIRTGQPCYLGDVATDPRFTPWAESARRHGYASVMAVPLQDGERNLGALNIYAPEPDAFDEEERALMVELASNLSQGILAFRTREERDRMDAELRLLNESLERRVAERTAALGVAMCDLEAFTYSVSHDLRAPLRHIDGFSKVLLDQHAASLNEEGRHYLERVRQATQRMGRLIDDLLKLSRIGRSELHCEPVDLNVLVREVIEDLRTETAGRNVDWRVGSLPVTGCDVGLVRQAFFNLLSNAVKFTRGRDPAVIEVGFEGGEFFVRDNGVGFDPHYADKLFGVFQRLHRVEDFEGTGVGLATVRRIVRKHGGDVRAEASPERGADFHFTLAGADVGPGVPSEVPHAA